MLLEYKLDISGDSVWKIATPAASAMRLPFYMYDCGYFICNSDYFTRRKGVDAYLLYMTVKGKGQLTYKDENVVMDKNSIVIIHCEEDNLYKTLSEESWEYKWVFFGGVSAMEFVDLINKDGINVMHPENFSEYLSMLSAIIKDEPPRDIKSSMVFSKRLNDLLTKLYLDSNKNDKEYEKISEKLENAIIYMQKNYKSKISLDEIAKASHLSKYHFSRVFKEETGLSPYNYLMVIRVDAAKNLLNTSKMTLDEIAVKTGFLDSKSLILNFSKVCGYTPGEYRKQNEALHPKDKKQYKRI